MVMYCKKLLALALAAVLTLGFTAALAPDAQAAGSFSAVGGWNESIYAEIDGIEDASVTAVSYSGAMSGQLVGQDLEYLVRQVGTGVRIDIPGLKAGTYSLTVTAGGVTYTQSGIEVTAYDRSGYAHWNYTEGVGAYNDDGTLKANATVLYVTEENKDTVSITAGGLTVSGIGNILNTGGKEKSDGLTSKGGKANTNGGILEKLAQENRPLVVRIVGHVTKPQGVTAWGSIDYGGNTDDNGGMCNMSSCRNITIEGIGNDAVVDGWGFAMNTSTGDTAKGYGKNFEFRNITFQNVPEDCIGLSGKQVDDTVTDPVMHCWAHNCAFYGPKNLPDASADQDKGSGDGALDFKAGEYMTMDYCYFEAYHKTHLIGGGDTNLQYNVTWHHNYYKNCESRAPLGRQANLHIYNNLTEGQTSYCMSARANCYIYSEYNTFINSKKISDNSVGGIIKSYNDSFQSCTGTDVTNLVIATSRNQQVASTNKYPNFDTNPEYGYLADGSYSLETDTAAAAADVKANAGPMKLGNLGKDTTEPGETPVPGEGDYIHNFTESGLNSFFYTITGNLSNKGTVEYNGLSLTQCLKLESATSIVFTAPASGTLVLVFHETGYNGAVAADCTVKVDDIAYDIDEDNTAAIPLEAGEHTIKKGSAQIYLYYMFFSPKSATGVTVSGTVTSFGGETEDVTIQLIKDGETEAAYTVTVQGTSAAYSITGVAPGTYTMKVSKTKHAAREYTVTVASADVAQNAEILLYGDVTGDGLVNSADATQINRYFSGKSSVITGGDSETQAYLLLVADVYSTDHTINATDATQIKRHFSGKSSVFTDFA
ncbi:MAG: dockerin type I domain-containing protein [Faecousia sp.]